MTSPDTADLSATASAPVTSAAPAAGTAPSSWTRRSPLLAEHEALGANLTEFGGWSMPLRYGSDIAEHRSVRTAAGVFDISHMGQILVTGPQAAAALDHALVGWISLVDQGRARYTMITQPDGGVIDDLVVYRTGEQEYVVVANAGNADVVLHELVERASGFDATVSAAADQALIAVQGPLAVEILAPLADSRGSLTSSDDAAAIRALRYYAITDVTLADVPVRVARTGYTGEDGFEIFVAARDAVTVWRAVLAVGGGRGLVPAGLSARDSLRLEAGMPLYGHEIDRTTTPYEAGLGRVVRLDKVDRAGAAVEFVGRTALAARRESEPARVLVGLRAAGRRALRAGDAVVRSPESLDAPLGVVTSGAPSPTLGHPVAMAYVSPELSAEGTEVTVVVRGRAESAVVVPLPFYRRPR